jgi:predicted nicotinamide N-methyase
VTEISAAGSEMPVQDAAQILAGLMSEAGSDQERGTDRLRRAAVPIVPEIELYLAVDAVVLGARLAAMDTRVGVVPFWASAWAGSQGLARYVLDNPGIALGRKALDIASGSGLAAIAAAMAGAEVIANDIDPLAVAAIEVNAALNGVRIIPSVGDLSDGDGEDADLVMVGDAFYNTEVAERMLPFLRRVAARGGDVLIGDPGRGHLPEYGLEELATYSHAGIGAFADHNVTEVSVFRLTA